jgi:parallel beta-helix repeat protein
LDGIFLYDSNSNTISGNTILNSNWSGISLYYSKSNTINGNNIISNNEYGVYLRDSLLNFILKNNFIDNKHQARFTHYYADLLTFRTNRWKQNYWNRPHLLPSPIFGELYYYIPDLLPPLEVFIPWFPQIDWFPAKKPYVI